MVLILFAKKRADFLSQFTGTVPPKFELNTRGGLSSRGDVTSSGSNHRPRDARYYYTPGRGFGLAAQISGAVLVVYSTVVVCYRLGVSICLWLGGCVEDYFGIGMILLFLIAVEIHHFNSQNLHHQLTLFYE